MSGRHPFSELIKDFTPERRRRVDDMKRVLLAEMPLHGLRRAQAHDGGRRGLGSWEAFRPEDPSPQGEEVRGEK